MNLKLCFSIPKEIKKLKKNIFENIKNPADHSIRLVKNLGEKI